MINIIAAVLVIIWLISATDGLFAVILAAFGLLSLLVYMIKDSLDQKDFYNKLDRDRELRKNGIDL
jgi:hypothetical protein